MYRIGISIRKGKTAKEEGWQATRKSKPEQEQFLYVPNAREHSSLDWFSAPRAAKVAPSPPEFHNMALPLQHHSALPTHMALCCSPTHRTPCRGWAWGTRWWHRVCLPPNLRGGPTLWNPGGTGSAIWAYGRGGGPDVFVSPISFFSLLDGKNACVFTAFLQSIQFSLFPLVPAGSFY